MIGVPLWLASTLKKSKKCRIKLPEWMNENELKNILQQEKENETFYNGLPFYYREISKIIFDIDSESVNHKNIRVLIQDIEDVRESKTKKGLKQLVSSTYIVHLNNISSNQLNKNIRINVCHLLNYFYDITQVGPNSDTLSTQNQSQSQQNTTITSINSNLFSQSTFNSSSVNQQENDSSLSNNNNNNNKNRGQPMRKLRRMR